MGGKYLIVKFLAKHPLCITLKPPVMKTKVLTFAAISAVLFTTLLGCNKTSLDKDDLKEEVINPFDFVGELHNQGLDYIYGNLATKSSSASEDEILELVDNYCNEVYSEDNRFTINLPNTKADNTEYDSAEEEVTISAEVSNYIAKIMDVASTDDYEYIKEQFSAFEEDIILNKTEIYTDYETNLLLCSLAIGKYSNEYWKDYNISTKSAAGEIVGADVAGALAGIYKNIVPIALCAALGGPGCGLAAAGRAALGPALGASAAAGISIGMGMLF